MRQRIRKILEYSSRIVPLRWWSAWLICLVPRLAFVLLFGYLDYYTQLPTVISTGNYPFSYSGVYPLYMVYAAALNSLSFSSPWAFVFLNIAVQSLLGPLVLLLSRELKHGIAGSWLSVVGVAFLPYYVSIAGRQPQLGLTIILVALLLLLFLRWFRLSFRSLWGSVGLGITGTIAGLLRPNVVLTLIALYAFALFILVWRSRIRTVVPMVRLVWKSRVLISISVFVLLQASIGVKNILETGHLSSFTNSGYNLYVGNNLYLHDYIWRHNIVNFENIIHEHGVPAGIERMNDPYEIDNAFKRIALDYMQEHPYETIKNTLVKGFRYWDWRLEDAERNSLVWNLTYSVPYLLCLLLAVFGVREMYSRHLTTELLILLVFVGSYFVPHMLLFGTIRMRMTTEFVLVLVAAFGAASIIKKVLTGTPGSEVEPDHSVRSPV